MQVDDKGFLYISILFHPITTPQSLWQQYNVFPDSINTDDFLKVMHMEESKWKQKCMKLIGFRLK